jgi:hypothetical protein
MVEVASKRVSEKEFVNTKANRVYVDYYGDFRLVGDGKVTSNMCGVFRSLDGCIRVELHKGKIWKGKDCTGKVYVRRINLTCKRSSCPICFKHGWAKRQAGNVENRLSAISKKLGGLEVEHIVVSLPKSDYDLGVKDYRALRLKVVRLLKSRGVFGGCMIFHAYRFSEDVGNRGWYASPHFHVLGFVHGGYKCRECSHKFACVKGCGGFDDVSYQAFLKDGYYVKVLAERNVSFYDESKKNVYGTAWYQLNHASYLLGFNRFHICTWFGVCAQRLFKCKPALVEKVPCPICKHDVEKLVYLGGLPYYEKWRREKGSPNKSNEFLMSYFEDGRVAFGIDDRKASFGYSRRKRRGGYGYG